MDKWLKRSQQNASAENVESADEVEQMLAIPNILVTKVQVFLHLEERGSITKLLFSMDSHL